MRQSSQYTVRPHTDGDGDGVGSLNANADEDEDEYVRIDVESAYSEPDEAQRIAAANTLKSMPVLSAMRGELRAMVEEWMQS